VQTTLKRDIKFVGTGLHSGRPARISLRPAPAGHGIVFHRTDVTDRDPMIPARFNLVSDTTLNTRLQNAAGVTISTVEHLLAALAGTGVHNVLVEIDGPEVPVMDGSSRRYVRDIFGAGVKTLDAPLEAWAVRKPVEIAEGDVLARLEPGAGLVIDFEIVFPDAVIGHQSRRLDMANGAFARELSDCRTFCRRSEIDFMHSKGLALGGSLDNAVVVDGDDVLNHGGFRRADECVRHKMLDALGDLTLAGLPIIGTYVARRAGHGPTNRLLRELFATPGAVVRVTVDREMQSRLPGYALSFRDLAAAG